MEATLALDQPGYYPGDILRCAIKVVHTDDAAAGPGLLTLSAECSGTERTDPGWVSGTYHPEHPAAKDGKRLSRSILASGQLPLLADAPAQAGFSRTFFLRLGLPSRIPPSYRGSAASFQYHLAVRGSFKPDGASAPSAACEVMLPFQVWPRGERAAHVERRSSMAAPGMSPAWSGGLSTAGSSGPLLPGGGLAVSGGGAAAAGGAGEAEDLELVDYRVGVRDLKYKAEELLLLQPSGGLHGAGIGPLGGQPLSPTCALLPMGSLALTGEHLASLSGGDADDAGGPEADGQLGLPAARHLTPLQRAHLNPRTFELKAGDHPLVRITVQGPADALLQPGGTLSVLLDFRAAHGPPAPGTDDEAAAQRPQCLQVTALLESQEVIHPPFGHSKGQHTASMRKLYSEQQDTTACLLISQFIFSIPPHAPVSFKTPVLSHRWMLRFELSVHYPGSKRTEQLLWSLPVVVFPPPPLTAS